MSAASPSAWQQWYGGMETAWNVDTPQKDSFMWMGDMSLMYAETPDKLPMPGHLGHEMAQAHQSWDMGLLKATDELHQSWDMAALKAAGDMQQSWDMGTLEIADAMQPPLEENHAKMDDAYSIMPVEAEMIPKTLFDSSPEKSDQGKPLDCSSSHSETTNSGDGSPGPLRGVDEPASPRPGSMARAALGLLSPGLSPSVHSLASPVPTRRPQCYVAETPSPDRMHYDCSWTQPSMPFAQPTYSQPLMPWHVGPDQVIPEFMQMLPQDFQNQQMLQAATI
jgi:hypothetical protein